MRSLIAILTLVVFSYIQLYNAGAWVAYQINKTEIIQKFCENKDKPQLKCEGTCHMKKMMIDESSENGDHLPMVIIPEILLFISKTTVEIGSNEMLIEYLAEYVNYYSFDFLDDWVIPPKG